MLTTNVSSQFDQQSFPRKPSSLKTKKVFKEFMGKEFSINQRDTDIDHIIYSCLKSLGQTEISTLLDSKIEQFHPINQQALLTRALDLALIKNQPERVEKLKKKLEELKYKAKELPDVSPFEFNAKLEEKEEKSYFTMSNVLKVIGGLALFTVLSKIYFNYQNELEIKEFTTKPDPRQNEFDSDKAGILNQCFERIRQTPLLQIDNQTMSRVFLTSDLSTKTNWFNKKCPIPRASEIGFIPNSNISSMDLKHLSSFASSKFFDKKPSLQAFTKTLPVKNDSEKKEKEYLLKEGLILTSISYINDPHKLQSLSKSIRRTKTIYFLDEIPVVLKKMGIPESEILFHKMRMGWELCDTNGYSHIVIPKAKIHGEFIIENRLPIGNSDYKQQIGLYLEHKDKFTEAIKEFTAFLCQAQLSDITGGTNHLFAQLNQVPIGRYDNVALYLDGKDLSKAPGKIGLIDLDEFSLLSERAENTLDACLQAIRFFPAHFDEIISTAKKFDPTLDKYMDRLKKERDDVSQYFRKVYQDHYDFIKQKEISLSEPAKFSEISVQRREKIRAVVEVFLLEENDKSFHDKNFLGENPKDIISSFNEKEFPQILDAIKEFITCKINYNMQSQNGNAEVDNYPKLLSLRTFSFEHYDFAYGDLIAFVSHKLIDLIDSRACSIDCKITSLKLAEKMVNEIFQELEKGREIAYYNPGLSGGRIIFA